MFPLKLVRSLLVSGQILPHNNNTKPKVDQSTTTKRQKTPLLLFTPTNELITDTYRLATIARDMDDDDDHHKVVVESSSSGSSNWDCCSISLFSRITGDKIKTMEGFCRVLTGAAWTLYKTNDKDSNGSRKCVYLFRKVDRGRVAASRIRELRLPTLDFRNAPLRILQYVVLMTDNVFYLAS
ncbi:hypothetical protein ACFE04_013811 [Oxalis oulophora]